MHSALCTVARFPLVVLAAMLVAAPVWGQEGAGLRVGAARIDITPPEGTKVGLNGYAARTEPFESVHDPLYYRAIALEDGSTSALILVGDVINISHDFHGRLTARLAERFGTPTDHILLAATHTHGAPAAEYRESDEMLDRLVALIDEARSNMKPARVGAGEGSSNVNINRRAKTMTPGVRWLGLNPDGPSDKTVAVVRFDDEQGNPIAVLSNFAVHGTVLGQESNHITGDLPGAAARHVETGLGGGVVAPWTSGAAGDQAPIYTVQRDFGGRIKYVDVLGESLGGEIVRVTRSIETRPGSRIRAAQSLIMAPGRKIAGDGAWRPDGQYEFDRTDPVPIRLSVLMIDHIALCGVSGEVLNPIAIRLKQESPLRHTIMVTNCNGSSGYLPDDESFKEISYETFVTRVQPGVEDLIVDGLLDMLNGL